MIKNKLNKMTRKKQFLYFCILIVLCLYPAIDGYTEKVYIDITSPYSRKIPVVIGRVEMEGTPARPDLPEKMRIVMNDDLDFSGFFIVRKNENTKDNAFTIEQNILKWKKEGVSLFVASKVLNSSGKMAVEFRLYDVVEERFIVGRRYNGREEDYERMAHRFCDEILDQISGIRGPFETRIAYVSEKKGIRNLIISDYNGKNPKVVTNCKSIMTTPIWSSDGSKVIYNAYRNGKSALYIVDLVSGTEKKVNVPGSLCLPGDWSPDGSKVAITLSIDGNSDIYLLDVATGKVSNITKSRYIEVSPTWSPDGKKIAFNSNRHGTPQIFVIDLSSSDVKRITYSGNYNTSPDWSPNGDKIVFTAKTGDKFDIAMISPAGNGIKYLTSNSGDNESPSWSPDGRYIVFTSSREGEYKIFVMTADGGNQRKIGTSGGKEITPHWSPYRYSH
ncbi:MAG: Tol-Pal system beta propeller repeat protein TolB [Candidatus Schekmanbacteria bacterium]|nr:Tol-Pal system beta propeller repeat protein TolB [Candidatus Schekmanbacteria bacterium]